MTAEQRASGILADHGLRGSLMKITPSLWQLRGEIGSKGCAVEFDGEPGAALLTEAAGKIKAALAA